MFHLLVIAMNSTLHEFELALTYDAWDTTVALPCQLTNLYHAATASMKYVADFRPTVYGIFIRPSMAPLWLSEGFSGALNRGHEDILSASQKSFVQGTSLPSSRQRGKGGRCTMDNPGTQPKALYACL